MTILSSQTGSCFLCIVLRATRTLTWRGMSDSLYMARVSWTDLVLGHGADAGDPRGLLPGGRLPDGRRVRADRVLPLGPALDPGAGLPPRLQIPGTRHPKRNLRGPRQPELR